VAEFLKSFLSGLKAMSMIVIFLGGLFGPTILLPISGWFFAGYFITIPLCFACLSRFAKWLSSEGVVERRDSDV
jgi:hypothetical protein